MQIPLGSCFRQDWRATDTCWAEGKSGYKTTEGREKKRKRPFVCALCKEKTWRKKAESNSKLWKQINTRNKTKVTHRSTGRGTEGQRLAQLNWTVLETKREQRSKQLGDKFTTHVRHEKMRKLHAFLLFLKGGTCTIGGWLYILFCPKVCERIKLGGRRRK